MDSIKFLSDLEVTNLTVAEDLVVDGEVLQALTDEEIIAMFEEVDMSVTPTLQIAEELSV